MTNDVSTSKGTRRLFLAAGGLVVLAVVLLLVLFENRRTYLMNETRARWQR